MDGKAQHSLAKLQLFRQFYVMVVVYVYFTRIVVYVLAATIPFYLLWLGPMATELATFIFFTVTGTFMFLLFLIALFFLYTGVHPSVAVYSLSGPNHRFHT